MDSLALQYGPNKNGRDENYEKGSVSKIGVDHHRNEVMSSSNIIKSDQASCEREGTVSSTLCVT